MDKFETAKQFFFEGLRLLEANDFQGAEAKFAKALELIPDRLSTLNNLSATKIKLKKFAEAEKLARQAVAASDKSPEAWSNLGIALAATGRQEEALQACDRALSCNVAFPGAWLTKATTLLELKRYEEALQVCEQSLNIDPGKHEVLYTKGLILNELKRPDEARKMYRKALELRVGFSPVFVGERCATQKADVLIINPMPDFDSSLKSVDALYLSSPNFPGQLASHIHEDFHFTYVFADDASRPSARSRIPQPDFVMNNHANGELLVSEGSLPRLSELVDNLGVPVVNHPTKAVQSIRDVSAKLLEGIPGILVPKTLRFSSVGKTREELVHEIEHHFNYPLITRTLAFQTGIGMNKADNRDALVKLMAEDFPDKFFVTQFVDSRHGDELFRKIRAAVVNDEIMIVRVDYDTDWKVHGRRKDYRVAFYLENMHLLGEEKRIIQDPEAGLGRPALQSLRAVRERIALDVFGIDFAVDADGLLVFYEANATMNLFSTARKEVPNPPEADDCLRQAFCRYFTSLIKRR